MAPHRNFIGARFVMQVLWISYGALPGDGSHSYGHKPSYRSKERSMIELLILIVGVAVCCLLLFYDQMRGRL